MILLFDIGNTHTHIGLSRGGRIIQQKDIATAAWGNGSAESDVLRFVGARQIEGAILCSVVPKATPKVEHAVKRAWGIKCQRLTSQSVRGVGIDYPRPETIGADRLANALAANCLFGAPVVVIDFGTAVTFDVVDRKGNYVGGIIAPGLAAMTDYLHEKTALLPRIRIREVRGAIGKSTEKAMLIGAVKGYRGLIRELIGELRTELGARRLPVIATGGYARLISAGLAGITSVEPLLTLKGLSLAWQSRS
jgi:type III pantothenate kinase